MRTIGLIGGMSWESTETYYRRINEGIKERLGGLHSAEIILHSIDFGPMEELQRKRRWKEAAAYLTEIALGLESGGADMVLICTNTMHIVAPEIEQALSVPLLHIADAAGEVLSKRGVRKAGLLGTKFTMQQDFYRLRINRKFGIDVSIPEEADRNFIHDIIYNQLCLGELRDSSRDRFLEIIDTLSAGGAESVILGCTEIPLLVQQKDTDIPLLDTTTIHAQAAVNAALA
jgi:aspartate racemase